MSQKKTKKEKWTWDKIQKIVLCYKGKSKNSLRINNQYIFSWAKRNGKEKDLTDLVNKTCMSTFEARSTAKKIYSDEYIFLEFKKYKSYRDLLVSPDGLRLISLAQRRNIMKKATDHFDKKNIPTNSSIGEESVRFFLNQVFNCEFLKVKHKEIVNPKTGRCLELDGFNEKKLMAFEYGDHRSFSKNKNIESTLFKDRIKLRRCKSLGIKLVIVKKDFTKTPNYELELKNILRKEFKRLGIEVPSEFDKTSVVLVTNLAEESRELIISKIKLVAKSCLTIKSFKQSGFYYKSIKIGFFDEVKKIIFENKKEHFNIENVLKIALKYKTKKDFYKNDRLAYNWSKRSEVFSRVCSHMKKQRPPGFWNKEELLDLAYKSKSLKKFRENGGALCAAKRLGVYSEIKQKLTSKILNIDVILKKAREYSVYSDFIKENRGMYCWLIRNKKIYLIDWLRVL